MAMNMDRRGFLSLGAAAAAGWAMPVEAKVAPGAGRVKYIFFTDTHLEPELKGDVGSAQAFAKIKAIKPEFCIQGGDHCFDLAVAPRERSMMLLDLYQKTEHTLDMPIHHVLGNHDVFGRGSKSGVSESDPLYGKKAFEQKFDAKTYRSWDYKGYHFIVLDSVQITPDRYYSAWIDDPQIAWLKDDLAAVKPGMPIVISVHCPLISAANEYKSPWHEPDPGQAKYPTFLTGNAWQVLPLFEGHNILGVFQGHTHLNEVVYWRDIPFITSGAICGNWWMGSRWGTPEGFTVVELDRGRIRWRYETYGWTSVKPEADPLPVILQPSVPGSWPTT